MQTVDVAVQAGHHVGRRVQPVLHGQQVAGWWLQTRRQSVAWLDLLSGLVQTSGSERCCDGHP